MRWAYPLAPRIVSIIGSRPEIIQAAPLSVAFRPRRRVPRAHGSALRPGMSGPADRRPATADPRYNLGVGSLPDQEQLELTTGRSASSSSASGRTRFWSAATPTPRSPARGPPAPTTSRSSTSRRAFGATAPTCPRSATGSRPTGSRTFCSRPPRRPANLVPSTSAGTVYLTGDPLADVLLCPRDQLPAARAGRVPARDCPSQLQHRRPERLSACSVASAAADRRVIFPLHPRTRTDRAGGLEAPGQRRAARAGDLHARCSPSSAARVASPPIRVVYSARPTCGASRASRFARRPSGSRPWRPAGTRWLAWTRTLRDRPSDATSGRAPAIFGDGNAPADRRAHRRAPRPTR